MRLSETSLRRAAALALSPCPAALAAYSLIGVFYTLEAMRRPVGVFDLPGLGFFFAALTVAPAVPLALPCRALWLSSAGWVVGAGIAVGSLAVLVGAAVGLVGGLGGVALGATACAAPAGVAVALLIASKVRAR
ncbi:MAG: hypothetical protein ACRD1K_03290 [Acidimicrobiales bacterium]